MYIIEQRVGSGPVGHSHPFNELPAALSFLRTVVEAHDSGYISKTGWSGTYLNQDDERVQLVIKIVEED